MQSPTTRQATGKLDISLAREPQLKLAPAGVGVVTYDVQGGIDAVKKVRRQAEELIAEARHLLKTLASETVVSVTNIPLATYPDAIKSAVKLIDQDETVIPLPVVEAQHTLKEAETFAEKKDRTQKENNRLEAAMNQAREHLEFAHALGYGTNNDFAKMYVQLNEIRDKTAANNSGSRWFAKIKASVEDFLKSSQPKNS